MKKTIVHSLVLVVGIFIGYGLNYLSDVESLEKAAEPEDISFFVYEIKSQLSNDFESFNGNATRKYQLSDGQEIDIEFNTSTDEKTKMPIVRVDVNDASINIDRNGTAVIGDLLIGLVDLDAYSKINKEYIAGAEK